jgi:hypothetical protein
MSINEENYVLHQDDCDELINSTESYSEYLESIKKTFNDFIRLAEVGKTVRSTARRSRRASMLIATMMRDFRKISINNDKKICAIYKNAKKKIENIE